MEKDDRIVQLLADIRRLTRDPYPWEKVRALGPLFVLRLICVILYILSVLGQLLGLVAVPYTPAEWLLNTCIALCLLVLSRAHSQYRVSAVFMLMSLLLSLVSYSAGQPPLLMLMSTMCHMGSACFEYFAHAKLTMRQDRLLTRRWNSLFLWNMAAMLGGGGIFLLVMVASYLFPQQGLLFYLLTLAATYLPDLTVDLIYLWFLRRTIRLIQSQKVLL